MTDLDQSNPRVNPFAAVRRLIQINTLTAEVLICGGDLGDRASPTAQQYAWKEVVGLAGLMGAKHVLGAVGNHDIDSRFGHTEHDAKGQVQALEPPFPISEEHHWLEYWAKNYTITEFLGIRFAMLNSAAFHGYANDPKMPEYMHGRISDRTLDAMITKLQSQGEKAVNVLICHHHPMKNELVPIKDYSEMKNGDRLVNAISAADVGPWLIVHGHKHIPRLYYAAGGSGAPVIFSAGSFSARLYPEIQNLARNEFYLLDLEVPGETGAVGSVRGEMRVWQWAFGEGWIDPPAGPGMNSTVGFGSRADIVEVARELAAELKNRPAGVPVEWTDVLGTFERVRYMLPDDVAALIRQLDRKHGISALRDDRNELAQVQVRTRK